VKRYYVDITGVTDTELEMLGYYVVERNEVWSLYNNKGDAFVVHESGSKRCLYVEDINDAIILKGRPSLPAPPAA